MATVEDQNVPSELLSLYLGVLKKAVGNFWSVMTHSPWSLPNMRTGKSGVSPAQIAQREIFSKAKDCFNCQPFTGGVGLGEIGARSREWWFIDAWGTGLWYYDYFMQQTMNEYLVPAMPDWCHAEMDQHGLQHVFSGSPNFVYRTKAEVNVGPGMAFEYIAFGRREDEDFPFCHTLDHGNILVENDPTFLLKVFRVDGDWDYMTLTWNNHPAILEQVAEQIYNNPRGDHDIAIPVPVDVKYFAVTVTKQILSPVRLKRWEDIYGTGYIYMGP